jgi:CubicO group peptidase (beta-lactamase class C family)
MRLRSLLTTFLLTVLAVGSANAQQANTDSRQSAVDALFADYAKNDSPGAAVSVYQGGKLALARGYGRADLEAGTPITPQTQFHVASVSKEFTAFSIALLAREGKVDLDADIRTYLPYVPDFGHKITVRHLILHTSGLRDQWSLFELGGQNTEGRVTQQQIVNMVSRQQGLNFTPGTEYVYCNTGYSLMAEIVYKTSGKTLREFTTERIFKPLGMNRTFFFDDVTELVPGRANSYAKRRDKDGEEVAGWQRELLNYDNYGATSLFTTVEDMAKWAANFTTPVVGDRALIDQISTNGTLDDGKPINYGFALRRIKLNGRVIVTHSGADAGFRAVFVYFPGQDFAVSITANTPFDMLEKVGKIADLYLPPVAAADVLVAPEEDPAADIARLAGTYLPAYAATLRLEAKDGALYLANDQGEPRRIILRKNGTFDFGQPESEYFKPVADGGGQVVALDHHVVKDNLHFRHERITLAKLDAATLAQYVGDYRSPELDITYTFDVADGSLNWRTLWSEKAATLRPVVADRFESTDGALGTVVFQRDVRGRIDGLLIHAGRARHIRLDRVGAAHPPIPAASSKP